jgi:hypothetical protein
MKYLNISEMKKLLGTLMVICLPLTLMGQSGPVDQLFDKYAEKEGFTVVTISSKMFGMFASMNETDKGKEKDKETGDIVNRLKSIKILTVEDSLLNKNINFYTELSKKLDFSEYEELMLVKEGPDITKFLIRQKGDVITELLVITGGPGGNSLISIKGDLNLKSISEISKDVGMKELKGLDELDKSKNKK